MTARLILARHGNTFRPEDTPVWIGARTDMPLVEKGVAQAEALGDALRAQDVKLAGIVSGPLKRTFETARIVAAKLQMGMNRIRIDARLREIDYGNWEGLSTEQIIAQGYGPEVAIWNKESHFPVGHGWKPVQGQITAEVNFILADMEEGTRFLVTSNGILRFFAAAAANAAEIADRKVATGNACVMERQADDYWRILQWDQPPHMLKA